MWQTFFIIWYLTYNCDQCDCVVKNKAKNENQFSNIIHDNIDKLLNQVRVKPWGQLYIFALMVIFLPCIKSINIE